jgi:nuclear GTP-binding protein
MMSLSDDEDDDDEDNDMPRFGKRPAPIPVAPDSPPLSVAPSITRRGPVTNAARLFTADELAVLPEGLLDRQRQKQLAKKAKKKRAAAGLTEAELMAGFVGMDVEEQDPEMDAEMGEAQRPSKKQMRKEKKKAQKVVQRPTEAEMDAEARQEADFASFLHTVGGEFDIIFFQMSVLSPSR